jgi:2'-5' RNA ligase
MGRRLFFALWPSAPMQEQLVTAATSALGGLAGRAVPTANLHVTLAFLGAVPEPEIASVRALARTVARDFAPEQPRPALTLDQIDYWPRAEVLCATARQAPVSIAELAASFSRALVALGRPVDSKPFRPHVTLARKVARGVRGGPMLAVSWVFTGFALVESTSAPGGSLYSSVDSWLLGAE